MNADAQVAFPRRRSLAVWAVFSVFMVVMSYVVALSLALGCLSLVLVASNSVVLAIGGPILGLTILWSLIPRRDRFEPPGILLQRSRHPRLFAELDRIAASLNEKLPSEVYLIPNVNAWVTQRGGAFGAGSRRIMGIGLPLLGVLNISQFRAILAHEFAHYYGGDTRLGPWVYKTRNTMVRTFKALGEPSAVLQVAARFPFVAILYHLVVALLLGYWKLFLRSTQFISRKQEYRADELACHVAGSRSLIDGLRAINRTTPVLQAYWNSEVAPIMVAGFVPPIAEGFAAFVSAPSISPAIDARLEQQLREEKTQAFDSHPPLRDRITKASECPTSADEALPDGDAPAFTLVDSLNAAELELVQLMIPSVRNAQLTQVAWEGIKAKVVTDTWKNCLAQFSSILRPIAVSQLLQAVRDLRSIASQIPDPPGMLLTREQRNTRALEVLGIALGQLLLDHGWHLVATPGEFHLTREAEVVRPIPMVSELAAGKISDEEWQRRTLALGIGDCALVGGPMAKLD